MKKIIFKNTLILFLFLTVGCEQRFNTSKFNKQSSNYKICLKDANDNIETSININQDRIDMLQTDDTMVDSYNIGNDIDNIKLSKKREKMIEDCMKSR
tara:strand:+ start:188 stop:481 length:294 start_codon:yes stop_codon:yes gene_type:complete